MAFASVNGTQLYYIKVGHGLPCLVMHGGLGFDHTYLRPYLDSLGDTLTLLYYDHRGNGRSGRPPRETMTHEQFTADADALAEHLGFDRLVLIGHSYGGFIALEMAVRYPGRLSHLVLVDTAAVPMFRYADKVMQAARGQGASEEMLAVLQGPEPTDDAEYRRQTDAVWPLYWERFGSEASRHMMDKCMISVGGMAREGELQSYDMRARLAQIETPTLVMVGRHDIVTPVSEAQRLCGGLRHSELVIFEESGHFPFAEEGEQFCSSVRAWIGRGQGQESRGAAIASTDRRMNQQSAS